MARVGRDIFTGTLDRTHLVPRSLDYWRALCGSPVDRMDQDTWLKEIFEPHRKRLIERDLARGLDVCLQMSIRDDLTPRSLIETVSNEALLAALRQIQPVDDPVSLLGIADIASSRAQGDSRFAAIAEQTIRRLCEPELRRSDGLDIYTLFCAFVSFISAELRIVQNVGSQPLYWRQICSWVQAALLLRSFSVVTFDVDELTRNLKTMRVAELVTAELLDLQQAPLSHPKLRVPKYLRAEVLGRLLVLQQRANVQNWNLPGSDLAKAVEQQTREDPFSVNMPGPLELERLPYWNFESLSEHFQDSLRTMASELTNIITESNWLRFAYLAQLIRYEEGILTRITELTRKAELTSGNNDEKRTAIAAIAHMAEIAYLATAQRHAALAEAILARCLEAVGISTDAEDAGTFFRIGLIATATLTETTDRLAQYLGLLSLALPQGMACRALAAEIAVLKTFVPARDWHRFSRADALSGLGS